MSNGLMIGHVAELKNEQYHNTADNRSANWPKVGPLMHTAVKTFGK